MPILRTTVFFSGLACLCCSGTPAHPEGNGGQTAVSAIGGGGSTGGTSTSGGAASTNGGSGNWGGGSVAVDTCGTGQPCGGPCSAGWVDRCPPYPRFPDASCTGPASSTLQLY